MPHARALAILALLPLLLLGSSLLPGKRFLPLLPAAEPPLALEDPVAADLARAGQNHLMLDRLYPTLTDQRAIRAQVLDGQLPLWEPEQALGMPLLGNTMAAPLYPPHLLNVLLPPELAAGPLALIRMLLAGLGIWLLLGRLGAPTGARLVGALAMQAGGFGLENLHDHMKVDAALWLPWALWAVEGMRAGARRAPAALALSIGMALLAGFPPIAAFTCGVTALWALVRLAPRGPRTLGAAALSLVLGVGVAGAQLLPTLETAAHSTRQKRPADELAREAVPACTAVGLAVPRLFGAPSEAPPPQGSVMAWWLAAPEDWGRSMHANALEWSAFAGVFAVLLALAALVGDPRRAGPPALLLLLTFAYAWGWPLARLLYHLPGLGLGAPNRALSMAWPLWAWLAGLGAASLLAGERRALAATCAGATVLAAAAFGWRATIDPPLWAQDVRADLVSSYAHLGPAAEALDDVAPVWLVEQAGERLRGGLLHAGVFALAMAGAALLASRRRGPIPAWVPLALVVAAEGFAAGRPHLVPREVGPEGVFPPSGLIEAIREATGDGRVIRYDPGALDDVLWLAKPNVLHGYGIADATPYKALYLAPSVALFEALDPGTRHLSGVARLPDLSLLDSPVLDWARVTCVLSAVPIEHPRLEPVVAREGFHVYHRSGALPPARLVRDALPADDAFARIARGEVDPALEFLHHATVSDTRPRSSDVSTGTIELQPSSGGRGLDVVLRDAQEGWVVFHGAWMPGWRARVNGEPAEVTRADGAFRAVRVPGGERVEVETWYSPWSARAGALLSLASLLGLALWTHRGRRD